MPTLHLGVIELPYVQAPPKRRRRRAGAGTVTTGDVATWLEAKYHVMEIFYQQHAEDVVGRELINSLQGTIQSLMMGAPATIDPFGTATSKIEDAMKQFISMSEMERLGYPGVPTQAALMGVNSRLKQRRGPRRPSFRDTGLYESSMKAWVD